MYIMGNLSGKQIKVFEFQLNLAKAQFAGRDTLQRWATYLQEVPRYNE